MAAIQDVARPGIPSGQRKGALPLAASDVEYDDNGQLTMSGDLIVDCLAAAPALPRGQ